MPSPKPEAGPATASSAGSKVPDIATASVPDTLASLQVNVDTGLASAEVDVRRKANGYNEVAEKKVTRFSGFCGNFGTSPHGCSN
jgi:hypothetical protein